MERYQAFERQLRDRHAAQYDDWYRRSKGHGFDQRERRVFRDRAGDADLAVEFGSGTGRITEALSSHARTIAIDFSVLSLRQLHSKQLPQTDLIGASATEVPLRSETCDLVVSCQVLQHLRPSELGVALREAARVLRRNGRLLVSVYNRDYWRARLSPEAAEDVDRLYSRLFSAEEFTEVAANAGFTCVRGNYYKAIPDGGRVPAALAGVYAVLDGLVCRGAGRNAGCYFLYEGVLTS